MFAALLSEINRAMSCESKSVFECNLCQKIIYIFQDFRDHLKQDHGIKNKYIIKEMSDKRYVLDKREQKTNKEIQVVDLVEDEMECPATIQRDGQEEEKDTWLSRVQYQCLVCKSILNGLSIKTHMTGLHPRKTRSQFKAITPDTYTCKICHCKFSFLELKRHFWRKHRLSLEEYAKQYEAGEGEKENVEVEMKSKNTPEDPSELNPEQNNGKESNCRLCGRSFLTSHYLKRHIKNWHKDEPRQDSLYCCPFPPCSFSLRRDELKKDFSQAVNHIKILHSVESSNCHKIKWIKKRVA